MPVEEPSFHLTVGSRFENIELVNVVLDDALEHVGFDDDTRHWVDLAMREALANAIKHGNGEDPDKQVEVAVRMEGEELVIEVCDQGPGFEPQAVSDPRAPENLLSPNGRGIFYMKSFMDRIDYSFCPGGGTRVTLRKRLVRRPGPESE